jgi:4-carboxymuconolactone decarboxylase
MRNPPAFKESLFGFPARKIDTDKSSGRKILCAHNHTREQAVDTSELYARGLRRRKKMLGAADVEQRMKAAGEFGAPLQNIINAYVYGDIWERVGLSDDIRSLVMLGITAASNRPAEFRVHAKGALANGCTGAQVQDVLLLVAMYCGVPAAIETTRIAAEVFGEASAADPAARP